MTRIKTLLFLCLTALTVMVYGQVKPSGPTHYDSVRVVCFSIHKVDSTVFIEKGVANIDTASRYFHIYNPAFKSYLLSENLGNMGLASQNMVYQPALSLGFVYGNNSFNPYKTSDKDQLYFYSLLPFTELSFSQGFKKEQMFRVTHLHNVRNKLFMGVNYRINNAPGRDYFRQKASDHTLSVFMYYQTKNKRFGVFGDYIFNSIKNQENGGLTDDTVYLNYRNGSSLFSPQYFLSGASSFYKESAVHIKQYYFLARVDSSKINDTTKIGKRILLGRFIHSFDFSRQKFGFTSATYDGYFPLVMDTSAVADSSIIYQFKNSLEWTNHELNAKDKEVWFRYSAKLTHTYTEIRQMGSMIHFINLIPSVKLGIKPLKNLSVDVAGEYVLMNQYKNDYCLSGLASYGFIFKEKYFGVISLEGYYYHKEADWFYQHYHSRYFNWDNSFQKESILHAGVNYTYKYLKVGVDYFSEWNLVYMDAAQRPDQYVNGRVHVVNAYLFKKFFFWKFEIDNKVVYQFTDKPNLIRKPQLIAMQTYVFSTHLFKKALYFNVGIDLFYNTAYYADAYQPAYQSFYLQNTRKVGNYWNANGFLNLKVKRLRAFLKLSNFLSGAVGYDYFTVPHYPMQDRVFTLGLNWLFHD